MVSRNIDAMILNQTYDVMTVDTKKLLQYNFSLSVTFILDNSV